MMKMIQERFDGLRRFFGEVQAELKKCAWPTRPELYESTIVVTVSVIILAVFVGISDSFFMYVLPPLIKVLGG